jgi:peroxiredoxin
MFLIRKAVLPAACVRDPAWPARLTVASKENRMFTKTLFALVAAGGLIVASPAFAQGATKQPATSPTATPPAKQTEKKDDKPSTDKKKTEAAKIGEAAPSFELTDTDGKAVKLSDFKDKIVLIEWFNPECPVIVGHHKTQTTFTDLHKEFNGKGVVFLAINSSAAGMQGNGKDLNAKMKKDWNLPYPVLLDESGTVGKAYGAKTTPHVFIIGKDGKLAYQGAIDNQKKADDKEYKNYAKQALNQLVKGETVTEPETKAYGCGVKYGKN